MTLIFDNRADPQGQPGMHALVVGVSAYAHLPGGDGTPAADSFGMRQLTSAALTASLVASWLLERKDHFPVPLASCRLLLSPSPHELQIDPQLSGRADRASRAAFAAEAKQWREDASTHPENVTFFYFVGHGVQRSKSDAILLLEDFADPDAGGALTNAADINNLFFGMASSPTRPAMAETQWYFIDACRVLPSQFQNFERMSVPDIFNIDLGGSDSRRAPIFYAAIPGTTALARPGKQTLFSEALLACLSGAAAEPEEDEDGEVRWVVTTNSLIAALEHQINQLNKQLGAEQDIVPGGHTKNARLHTLDGPPEVPVVLSIDPLDALSQTAVVVREVNTQQVLALPVPVQPHPFEQRLPAGVYAVEATIDPPDSRFQTYQRIRPIQPPFVTWKVKVIP